MKIWRLGPTLPMARNVIAILLILVAGNAVVVSPTSAQVDAAKLKQKVVLIERPRGGGLAPEIGTGFFISPTGHILTAAHVLLNNSESDDALRNRTVRIRLWDRSRYVARILSVNRITDLALLKMKMERPTPYLSLGESDSVRIGDLLTIVGQPTAGSEWEISSGNVERVTSLEHIHVRATLGPGYSGGPAVDAGGRVVGVASYRAEEAEQSYLVPIDDALLLLSGVLPQVVEVGTTPAKAMVTTPTPGSKLKRQTKTPTFQNGFLRVTLRSFGQSADKKKINLSLIFENISKDDFQVSLIEGDANCYLIDDAGGLWTLSRPAVGITTVHSAFPGKSLFNPGQSSSVLFAFKPTGEMEGKTFDFGANLNGVTKDSGGTARRIQFSIGLSSITYPG